MSAPAVSVILPIYNVEPYLERCLRSLQAQTFSDFEAILVDDGSPDGCGAVIDRFSREDARFVPLHQANGGVGKARNEGIARASGRFIAFVDPDDFVGPNYLKHMVDAQKKNDADMVLARYVSLSERTMRQVWNVPHVPPVFVSRADFCAALPELYGKNRIGTLYAKLFKRALLEDLRYREKIKMRGDVIFVTEILERAMTLEIIDDSDYFYVRYAVRGITKQVDPDLFLTHIEVNRAIRERMETCGWMSEAMARMIDKRYVDAARLCVASIRSGPWTLEEKGAYVDRILANPEFRAAMERLKDGYPGRADALMREGTGAELVRYLDGEDRLRAPLMRVMRPLSALWARFRRFFTMGR